MSYDAVISELRKALASHEERLTAVEKTVRQEHQPTIEEHEDRLDNAERDLSLLRETQAMQARELAIIRSDVSRLANAATSQGLLLEKTFAVLTEVAAGVKVLGGGK